MAYHGIQARKRCTLLKDESSGSGLRIPFYLAIWHVSPVGAPPFPPPNRLLTNPVTPRGHAQRCSTGTSPIYRHILSVCACACCDLSVIELCIEFVYGREARCKGVYVPSTCSTCAPQPAQLGLLHLLHVTRRHHIIWRCVVCYFYSNLKN